MITRWIRVALAPAVLVTTGACATRTDVRILQNDLANLTAERSAADSANRAQLERVIATLPRDEREVARMRFAESLSAIVAQQVAPCDMYCDWPCGKPVSK